jgi:hypothetical protein
MASQFVQTTTVTGLKTFTFTLPNTDSYTIQGSLQTPDIVPSMTAYGAGGGAGTGTGGGPLVSSQVAIVIKQNATTIFTSSAGAAGFMVGVNATAGDVISVILSSSLAQDNQLNAVQCTIGISEGLAL